MVRPEGERVMIRSARPDGVEGAKTVNRRSNRSTTSVLYGIKVEVLPDAFGQLVFVQQLMSS